MVKKKGCTKINKTGVSFAVFSLLVAIAIFSTSISAASILPIYIRPLTGGSVQASTAFTYVFNFSTDPGCSNIVYNSGSKSITTDAYGMGFVELDISKLNQSVSYLCEYKDGSLRKVHNISAVVGSEAILGRNLSIAGDTNITAGDFAVNKTAFFVDASLGRIFISGQRVYPGTHTNLTQVEIETYINNSDYRFNNLNVSKDTKIGGNLIINKSKFKVDSNTGHVTAAGDLIVNYTIIGAGNNIRIGNAGTDSHSLTADDDLFVSGKLEVDGSIYHDGVLFQGSYLYTTSGYDMEFLEGGVTHAFGLFHGAAADQGIIWTSNSAGNQFVFTTYANKANDHDHPAQTNPTIFIHSQINPNTDNTEWMSFAYSNNDTGYSEGIIDTGKGPVKILPNLTAHQDFNAEADIKQGNVENIALYNRTINGTHVIFESTQSLPMTFTKGNVSVRESLYANTIMGQGDNVRIGNAGTDSHSLTADDDLFVSGKLEVDSNVYFDGQVWGYNAIGVDDDDTFRLGGDSNIYLQYDTGQTPDSFLITVPATSNSLSIVQSEDLNYDFAHPLQNNPTLFIHSATQSTTEWISFSHNTQRGIIDVGGIPKGNKVGAVANITEVVSPLEVNQETYFGNDAILGDVVSDFSLFELEINGTHVVINSSHDLPVTFVNSTDSWGTFLRNGTLQLHHGCIGCS